MIRLMHPLILASASPRRAALLRQMGLGFTVRVSDVVEIIDPIWTPDEAVTQLAEQKAQAVRPTAPDAWIVGADTIVVLDDADGKPELLGKPTDPADARAMLRRLSGRTHTVHTGFVVIDHSGHVERRASATRVTFAELNDDEIAAYVATGSPLDKAGAYGIQDDLGALFIPRIEGDYYTVVGLPVALLYATLKDMIAR